MVLSNTLQKMAVALYQKCYCMLKYTLPLTKMKGTVCKHEKIFHTYQNIKHTTTKLGELCTNMATIKILSQLCVNLIGSQPIKSQGVTVFHHMCLSITLLTTVWFKMEHILIIELIIKDKFGNLMKKDIFRQQLITTYRVIKKSWLRILHILL